MESVIRSQLGNPVRAIKRLPLVFPFLIFLYHCHHHEWLVSLMGSSCFLFTHPASQTVGNCMRSVLFTPALLFCIHTHTQWKKDSDKRKNFLTKEKRRGRRRRWYKVKIPSECVAYPSSAKKKRLTFCVRSTIAFSSLLAYCCSYQQWERVSKSV